MMYFIYGEDSYRSKNKLEEIILSYKKVHKSGLSLIYIDAEKEDFKDFYGNLKITSMFAEKKLIILNNVFTDKKFQEELLESVKSLNDAEDIIVVYENNAPDQRTKIFKTLQKNAICQEFKYLQPAMLKKWIVCEVENNKSKIDPVALDLIINLAGNDLWRMKNEINKLSNYKVGSIIKKEDVELLVKPNIENDIFKTIEAMASKDKKQALFLLHRHLENGDNCLYLLSMIAYQFRNLLIIKELQENGQTPYGLIAKKSGLHPFVVQKSYYLCDQFTLEKLKKIYQKIFQVDSDIKTGQVDAETALDLLLAEI